MIRLLLFRIAPAIFFSYALAVPGNSAGLMNLMRPDALFPMRRPPEQLVDNSNPHRFKFGSIHAEFINARGRLVTRVSTAVKIGTNLIGTTAHGLFPADGTIKDLARRVYYVPYGSSTRSMTTEVYMHHLVESTKWPIFLDIHTQVIDYAILRIAPNTQKASSAGAEDWLDIAVKNDSERMKFDVLVISIPRAVTDRYRNSLVSQQCSAELYRGGLFGTANRFITDCTGSPGRSGAPLLEADPIGNLHVRGFLSTANAEGNANASRLSEDVFRAVEHIKNGHDDFLKILPLKKYILR